MNSLKILLSFIFLFFITPAYAQQQLFPFVAQSKSNNVNVRSGQSANFESLGLLSKGDEVLVLEKKYSWYKVQLPPNFAIYISEKYVLPSRNKTGMVIGSRVNVRAAAKVGATVLTQYDKGQTVGIIKLVGDWYKIKPGDSAYGWVSDKYLKFKSKNVGQFVVKPILSPKEKLALEKRRKKEEKIRRAKELVAKKRAEAQRRISVKGKLLQLDIASTNKGSYQLLTDGKLTYILSEIDHIFDDFIDFKVSVEGKVDTYISDNATHPIINVNKIQLIL